MKFHQFSIPDLDNFLFGCPEGIYCSKDTVNVEQIYLQLLSRSELGLLGE